MGVNDTAEQAERVIALAGTVCGTLAGAALIVGFYAAFQYDRLAFWTWFAALAVLLPGDLLLSRFTGMLNMSRMTSLYAGAGLSYPRSRARIVVTFARFPIPLLVLAFLYSQVWTAAVSITLDRPIVPIAALFAAAGGAVFKNFLGRSIPE